MDTATLRLDLLTWPMVPQYPVPIKQTRKKVADVSSLFLNKYMYNKATKVWRGASAR